MKPVPTLHFQLIGGRSHDQGQNSQSRPAERQPPSAPNKTPPKRETPGIHENAETEEAERLLSRYSEAEQTEIAEVFKLLATTRKGGRMANSIILNCLRVRDTIDVNRVLYGIRIHQDRGLHLEGKKEPYLKAIMPNAAPAQIARKQSHTARADVSEVTRRNALISDLPRKEREEDA
jgi:hypothetical protein